MYLKNELIDCTRVNFIHALACSGSDQLMASLGRPPDGCRCSGGDAKPGRGRRLLLPRAPGPEERDISMLRRKSQQKNSERWRDK